MSKPPNRLLDFSPERTIQSVEKSPRSFPLAQSNNAKSAPSNKGKGKGRKAFDLTGGGGDYDDMETDAYDGSNLNNGTMNDDESIAPLLDDQPMGNSIDDQETLDADRTGEQPQAFEADDSGLMGPPATSGAQEPIKKRGRERKSKTLAQDELETSMPAPDQPRRGRPPKKTQVYQDPDANLRGTPSPRPKSKRLPPPSLRDPNARSKVKKTANAKPPSRAGSVAAGPRFIQRSETPANDSGALITRFGRQSIKPLASWRGEKTVMGDRTFDSLPGIKEVIRVDEVVEPRPRQRYRKGPHRAKARLADVEEEIEDEKAPWELDPGIVTAQVMEWDSNTNRYDEESTRDEGKPFPWPPTITVILTDAYRHRIRIRRHRNA